MGVCVRDSDSAGSGWTQTPLLPAANWEPPRLSLKPRQASPRTCPSHFHTPSDGALTTSKRAEISPPPPRTRRPAPSTRKLLPATPVHTRPECTDVSVPDTTHVHALLESTVSQAQRPPFLQLLVEVTGTLIPRKFIACSVCRKLRETQPTRGGSPTRFTSFPQTHLDHQPPASCALRPTPTHMHLPSELPETLHLSPSV